MSKEKQVHKNHRERMKELFLQNDFTGFTEIQKLEFMLYFAIPQKDTNPLAHKLLDEFGSLNNVLCADYNSLIKVDGIGKHAGILIKTFRAVCLETEQPDNKMKLLSSAQMRAYCYQLLRRANVEEFYVICMDNANRIIRTVKLGSGSANKVRIDICKITAEIFKYHASKIVVAHNHPSGHLEFSDDDIHFTHNILCNCVLNDIELTDHILVTEENAISMADSRHIEALYNRLLSTLNIKRKVQVDPNCPYEQYIISNPAKECPVINLQIQ